MGPLKWCSLQVQGVHVVLSTWGEGAESKPGLYKVCIGQLAMGIKKNALGGGSWGAQFLSFWVF